MPLNIKPISKTRLTELQQNLATKKEKKINALPKNDPNKRCPYTLKDILEIDFKEIWEDANARNTDLKILQEKIVSDFSTNNYETILSQCDRNSRNGQLILLNYIKLHTIYLLAAKLSECLDKECRLLANAAYKCDEDEQKEAMKRLSNIIKKLGDNISEIEGIVDDKTSGFSRLTSLLSTEFFDGSLPFNNNGYVFGYWSFMDIANPINSGGPIREDLWDAAIQNHNPTSPNIKDLMCTPEDNQIILMY